MALRKAHKRRPSLLIGLISQPAVLLPQCVVLRLPSVVAEPDGDGWYGVEVHAVDSLEPVQYWLGDVPWSDVKSRDEEEELVAAVVDA